MLRLVLCLLLFGVPGWADPEHGLIENRSGLPLTLPLQVKTDPGRDVYLVMRNAETTEIAVTAFIEGGRFFRLLMPPGTYTLHAAIGREWRGMEELFGAHTEFYTLPEALTFRAGATRKHGHLVDLTARDRLAAAPPRLEAVLHVALWGARQDGANMVLRDAFQTGHGISGSADGIRPVMDRI